MKNNSELKSDAKEMSVFEVAAFCMMFGVYVVISNGYIVKVS